MAQPVATGREPLTVVARARKVGARTLAQVRAVGVAPGWRPYRPERWSTSRWNTAYSTGEFDFMADLGERPRYAMLLSYLHLAATPPAILDVGCGPGILRGALGEMAFSSYVGVDLSEVVVNEAQRRWSDDRTRFELGDAATMMLPRVDVVVLNEMLYYVAYPRALLRRVAATVHPGGLVLTSIWRHAGDRSLWRLLDEELAFVAAARVRAERNQFNRLGWRVSCHRVRGG
jgi:2-polyprenyl-6-hydroxyphenyl methylase/3-demethylubiquinone-9 3-methyltransferase